MGGGRLPRGALLLLGLILWAFGAGAGAAPPAAFQAQAALAIREFHDAIEPPIAKLPYLCILEREDGQPLRDYVVRSYATAINSLLAKAGTADGERRAAKILRSIEHGGNALEMDQWFAESASASALDSRNAAAQGELPAALAGRMLANCGTSFAGRLGRTFQPLGGLAEPDYRRAAELDAADPWTWLVLAWLAEGRGEPDIERSLTAARALGNTEGKRVELLATLQLGRLRESQGRGPEADAALRGAVALAVQAAEASREGSPELQLTAYRDLGHVLNVLGAFQFRNGQLPAARDTMHNALALRTRLTQGLPAETALQIDVIATLQFLELVAGAERKNGTGTTPSPDYGAQAVALYKSLYAKSPYQPMMGGKSAWAGMAATALGLSALATLVAGLALLALFRRRVAHWMMVASPVGAKAVPQAETGKKAPGNVEIRVVQPGAAASVQRASALFRSAGDAHQRATWTHLAAGLGFGLLAALFWLKSTDTDLNFNRLAILTWSWAWPTPLVLGLIWAGDRRRQGMLVAGYLAVLFLLCIRVAMGETPPLTMFGITFPPFFQGIFFWANIALPSAILLLFLNRAVRSVGPPLLAMFLIVAIGATLAMIAASTPAGLEAMTKLFFRLSIPETLWMPATAFIGMAALAPLAWWVGTWLRALHTAKWMNDQSMVIDAIWLFQALMLCQEMALERGVLGFVGLACFVAMKLIALLGMRPAVLAARSRAPARLLLLRTFRRQRSSEQLFDLLGARWRYAGPITLIAAPDLASSTLDPDEFLDFLAGKLGQRFVIDPATLAQRLQAIDERPDPDGRYRVTELYCGSDTWQAAVRGLMARSDLVAMDLRGFTRSNQGCLFEVETLLDLVPAERMAFLVDQTTDQTFLREALADRLRQLDARSPNATRGGEHVLTLVDAATGANFAVSRLLAMGDGLTVAAKQ